jgi:hypothetical protein
VAPTRGFLPPKNLTLAEIFETEVLWGEESVGESVDCVERSDN